MKALIFIFLITLAPLAFSGVARADDDATPYGVEAVSKDQATAAETARIKKEQDDAKAAESNKPASDDSSSQ